MEKMDNIIWAEGPITLEDIKDAARIFHDPNSIHASTSCARKFFGDEATGPVAHGMLVLGILGGIVTREFGDCTIAHCVTDIKLSKCLCPGDTPGAVITITADKPRNATRFVEAEAVIYRKRDGEIVEATRKPLHLGITCPLDQ